MPEANHQQQLLAAESSARKRRTERLLRELRETRPLTPAQREALLAAASEIPVVKQ